MLVQCIEFAKLPLPTALMKLISAASWEFPRRLEMISHDAGRSGRMWNRTSTIHPQKEDRKESKVERKEDRKEDSKEMSWGPYHLRFISRKWWYLLASWQLQNDISQNDCIAKFQAAWMCSSQAKRLDWKQQLSISERSTCCKTGRLLYPVWSKTIHSKHLMADAFDIEYSPDCTWSNNMLSMCSVDLDFTQNMFAATFEQWTHSETNVTTRKQNDSKRGLDATS